MRERSISFGAGGGLHGILAEPSAARPGAPAIVLSNVGMHTRIGPNRMWVLLARELAAEGYLVLRFDLSGFGESEIRAVTLSDVDRAAEEQRMAVEFLVERRGAPGVVLVGFCSGVDGVHVAAVADPRVAGVFYLDGYAYPTPKFYLLRWTARLLRPSLWRSFVVRRVARLRQIFRGEPKHAPPVFDRTYPAPERLASDLRGLVARGVKLLLVWSEGREHEFNHADQFFGMLHTADLRAKVEVRILDRCDHLFSSDSQRSRLFGLFRGWLDAHFAPAPSGGPARAGGGSPPAAAPPEVAG